jgi:hypothetical protein
MLVNLPIDNLSLSVYADTVSDPTLKASLDRVSQVPLTCMGLHVRHASHLLTQIDNDALRLVGLVSNQFTLLVAIGLFAN